MRVGKRRKESKNTTEDREADEGEGGREAGGFYAGSQVLCWAELELTV